MKKRIILLTIMALSFQITCNAAEIKIKKDVEEGSYLVSGTFNEAKVNRSVGIKIVDDLDNVKYAVGVSTDENGAFSKEITLKGSYGFGTGGYYTLEAAAYDSTSPESKKIYFATDAEVTQAVSDVQGGISTSVISAIDMANSVSPVYTPAVTNAVVLGLDNKYYTAMNPAGKQAMDTVLKTNITNSSSAGDISDKFYEILACTALSQATKQNVKAVTDEFDYVFNFNSCQTYPLYRTLLANDSDVISVLFGTNKTTAADVKAAFNEKILLEGIRTAKVIGTAKSIYETYSAFFDFSAYPNWNIEKIAQLTVGKSYSSISAMYLALTTEYQKPTGDVPIIDGGLNGGGGGGSFAAPAVPAPNEIETFSDLSNHKWAKPAIEKLYKLGVVSGTGDGNYEPQRNVKREEFVIMILKAFELFEPENECSFEDVPKTHWAYDYIACAYNKGIVSGMTETSFGLNNNISREDMAVIIKRAAEIAGKSMTAKREAKDFTDASSISSYAAEAVEAMYCAGIISGFDEGDFRAKNNATRAEAAVMINNTL